MIEGPVPTLNESSPPADEKIAPPLDNTAEQITILLVDDEEVVLRVTGLMLTELGYRVLSAANGKEALELFHARRDEISLLLTDVVMPGMSGNELAKLIHRERSDLKIIYMSGFVASDPKQAGPALGPLLSKPFSPDQLSRAVQDALSD